MLCKGSKIIPKNLYFTLTEVNNIKSQPQKLLIMTQQISIAGKFGLDYLVIISTV